MSRARKRAERIRAEVPLDEVLYRYGYALIPNSDREQQFSCDLHGDGSDSKPSARFYPDSTSWHCFACSKSRDAISTVMEKEGLSFSEACTSLERLYGLPPLPWEEREVAADVDVYPEREDKSPEELSRRLNKMLQTFADAKDLPLDNLLRLWEIHDRVMHHHINGSIDDEKARQSLLRIMKTAMRIAKERVSA